MSSFGRAVLASRPDSAGPEAGLVSTASSAVRGTLCLTVTEGPVAGPPGEPARLHPASRVAAAATPMRPAQLVSLLIVCSYSSSRRLPRQDLRRPERAPPGRNMTPVSVSRRESSPLL